MAIFHVDDTNFKETLESITTPVFIKFGAPKCGPCDSLSETLQNLSAVQENKVTVLEIMVTEKNIQTATDYRVMGFPTLFFFVENKQKDKQVGNVPESTLKKLLKAHNIT